MALILLFILSLIRMNFASPTTYLSVDPPNTVDFNLQSGSTFTINVTVTNVIDLYAYEFHIGYNTTVLTATNIAVGPFLLPDYFEWVNLIDDAEGWLWYSVTQDFGETSGVNGSGVVAIITFSVDDYGHSELDLYETILGGSDYLPIDHEAIDGYFSNKILGDADSDGDVDNSDLFDLNKAYGSKLGDSNWDSDCDFDRDNKVDASDLFDLGKNYGRSYP